MTLPIPSSRWLCGLFAIGPAMPAQLACRVICGTCCSVHTITTLQSILSHPMRFTGYGSSIHKAINNAAYIAMAHMVHLRVELAAQYPYHPARPLGEEVHLYLSAECEPNLVLCNLAEYVRSSDHYHHVIGVELQQAHG
ncbi:hypothetical protein E2562_031783 [Oryza meyeriana var. granulata]|uniref:Secreted protein n=1 Tax=Oryza meyeriana var. granulata TaxID=110450 RepID=A0A6G1EBX6_9ORYZ|nr:hypothetical protein E2562_031783 [Oryza meyeriana var. granulata]